MMPGTQSHLSNTLHQMEAMIEESKECLLDTIKVPRNLGQITDRLPKANYNSNHLLKRNSSEPSRIGCNGLRNNLRDNLQSAKPSQDYLRGLAPINERDEQPRSADPARKDYGSVPKQPYEYRLRNEAKGYRDEKENGKPPMMPRIQEKSYLQKQGAAIIAGGRNNEALNQIYNSNNNNNNNN